MALDTFRSQEPRSRLRVRNSIVVLSHGTRPRLAQTEAALEPLNERGKFASGWRLIKFLQQFVVVRRSTGRVPKVLWHRKGGAVSVFQ